MEPHLCAP
jgi:calcium/calmodulin-dependent protein kinase I